MLKRKPLLSNKERVRFVRSQRSRAAFSSGANRLWGPTAENVSQNTLAVFKERVLPRLKASGRPTRVLQVGVGGFKPTGWSFDLPAASETREIFQALAGRKAHLTSVDVSRANLKTANGDVSRWKKLKEAHRVVLAPITSLPFKKGAFDVGFSMHVMPHAETSEPGRSLALAELNRAIRKGRFLVANQSTFHGVKPEDFGFKPVHENIPDQDIAKDYPLRLPINAIYQKVSGQKAVGIRKARERKNAKASP